MKSKLNYSNLKNIIFDFDGVILDSLDCKTEAFYQMYIQYGEDIAQKVKQYHILNGGVSRFEKFKTWHKEYLKVDLSKTEIQELADQFSELVLNKVANSDPIPGAIEFIKRYSKEFNFYIISGTPDNEIKEICKIIGIADNFKEILGSPKNKKTWCNELRQKYKELRNDNTIFLGDALSDFEAAQENNFYFALRSASYNEPIFSDIQVDIKFQSFTSLMKSLEFPKIKILVTTTSFQDSPGEHHDLLNSQDWDIDYLRGPLKEYDLLNIIHEYDGILCGDDEYTRRIIKKGTEGKLKTLAKYGVGLDKIDLNAASEFGLTVSNCPGINQLSVAEHVLALLLTFEKNIHTQFNSVQKGSWKRHVGREIKGKKIGIIGLGAIGKELSIIMTHLGLEVYAFDISTDKDFIFNNPKIKEVTLDKLVKISDYISIHLPLTDQTKSLIDEDLINRMKSDVLLINTSRGEIIDKNSIISALEQSKIRGYLCDVLDEEPIKSDEELLNKKGVIITPHVGSRTLENISKQGLKSVENLIKSINELNSL